MQLQCPLSRSFRDGISPLDPAKEHDFKFDAWGEKGEKGGEGGEGGWPEEVWVGIQCVYIYVYIYYLYIYTVYVSFYILIIIDISHIITANNRVGGPFQP